jgi:hypothetical protein
MIRLCKKNCDHNFQNRTYGYGQRVHTPTLKGHRCTVCGDHDESGAVKVVKKKKDG